MDLVDVQPILDECAGDPARLREAVVQLDVLADAAFGPTEMIVDAAIRGVVDELVRVS